MESNYTVIMKHVAFHEGGYTNHPKDPGKATNKGITQTVYDAYRRSKKTLTRHVKVIEDYEVAEIYRTRYWNLINGSKLPSGVDYCIMDCAVNSGVKQAGLWLQRAINRMPSNRPQIKVDGEVGPTTIDRADDYEGEQAAKLIDLILDERLGFLKIIRHKTTGELLWGAFGAGWTNRIEGFKDSKGKRQGGVRIWSKDIARGQEIQNTVKDVPVIEKVEVPKYTPQGKPGTGPAPLIGAIILAIGYAIWKAVS